MIHMNVLILLDNIIHQNLSNTYKKYIVTVIKLILSSCVYDRYSCMISYIHIIVFLFSFFIHLKLKDIVRQ